ncbi:MAG TPA: glycosyl hydrolase family 79 C-terminal domain-containing protein [Pirellulales bacterium]|jgi:hypothetical protein
MNRRNFLIRSGSATLGALTYQSSFGQTNQTANQPAADQPTTAEFVVDSESPSHLIPLNYNGLSYELAQLSNPNFFSGSNKQLIALFRLLSPQGVLRLGGNSSESCWFKADPSTSAPELRQASGSVAENWMPHRLFMIQPEAIDQLAEFLNRTGWQVIYGLNLGNSSPERAAKEAEYVAKAVGDHLLYFQIGNEPDFYHDANNATRPANWGFPEYLAEWTQFADAISQRVTEAKFGGPDVGSNSNWISKFAAGAEKNLGSRLLAVTGHYYAEGPPNDPKVTTARLLRTTQSIAKQTKSITQAAAKDHLIYRMTEGNSCYRGGKPGMSDAFASALWAGDYMLTLAMAGCAGVNFHGGSRDFLRASLGDHMPGEQVAANGNTPKDQTAPDASVAKGGYYTPIAGEVDVGFSARPIFYGMFLANQLAGANTRPVTLNNVSPVNATAYAGEKDGQLRIAVFNKDESNPLRLVLRTSPENKKSTVWRLTAPALDATSGITLAGSEISPAGTWSATKTETLQSTPDGPLLEIPRSSAALVFLDR